MSDVQSDATAPTTAQATAVVPAETVPATAADAATVTDAAESSVAEPAPARLALTVVERLTGMSARMGELDSQLAAAATALQAANDRVSALEAEAADLPRLRAIEAEHARVVAALNASEAAAATAAAAVESVPAKVAAQVIDTVAGLGIEPEALPAATAEPVTGSGANADGLKGLDRTRAAFSAQFAK